jgi:sugar (pentulose or hexulose) kinase
VTAVADALLTIDLGSTAIKTTLFDGEMRVLAAASREYQARTLDSLRVEMDARTYWDAFKATVAEVVDKAGVAPAAIRALGWSSQSETLVVVGRDGSPLRPVIVWTDNRAGAESRELEAEFGPELIHRVTGQVSMVPTWPAPKILWLRRHEPALFRQAHKFLLLEDFFIHRLTGKYVCEGSLITSTTYWNFTSKRWWPEMLQTLGISSEQLPEIMESGQPVGTILPEVAVELGLSSSTVVCTGALDQAAGAIGVGSLAPGVFSESTGGCVGICVPLPEPVWDSSRRMPCQYYALPDKYMAHTFTTGGLAFRWLRDTFGETERTYARDTATDAYDLLTAQAERVAAGSDGLIMLPHLQGAMAPDVNPQAKGVFFGFTTHHTKPHFTRAALESIAFVVRRNLEVIQDMGITVGTIRVLSGGAKSDVWNQIKADVTGCIVERTAVTEASSLGAALLAATAVGLLPSVAAGVEARVQVTDRYEPNPVHKAIYDDTYARYCALQESLRDSFAL